MGTFPGKKPRVLMSGANYDMIAGIVALLPPAVRKQVADHFATEFNKRSKSFDPVAWSRRTGGVPAPNSAR